MNDKLREQALVERLMDPDRRDPEAVPPDGWQPRKFTVRHWRRGNLPHGDAFVLVPDRDPAAVAAIVAYARATPDAALADHLLGWARTLGADTGDVPPLPDVLPSWVATLADDVNAGTMSVSQALFRIAGLVRGWSQ